MGLKLATKYCNFWSDIDIHLDYKNYIISHLSISY